MAITLVDHVQTANVVKSGMDKAVDIPVGTTLTIETSPMGEDILSETCPAGKVWVARVIVEITETDA